MSTISSSTGTLSSLGVGSGLDVNSIINKLVALEQQPLTALKKDASGLQAKLSAFGQLQSQIATLQTQARALATAGSWDVKSFTSGNSAILTGTADVTAAPATLSVQVSQLAAAQAAVSGAVPAGSAVGAGTLTIDIGRWSGGAFTPAAGGASKQITVSASDTVAQVAGKINAAGAGITATVVTDAAGDHLLVQSSATGQGAGFRIQVADADGTNTDNAGLSQLGFDPQAGAFGLTQTQAGLDATASINGLTVTSSSNMFSNAIAGVTFTVAQTTTSPVSLTIGQDTAAVQKMLNDFVSAYNALAGSLADYTKYDATTKSAAALQGDSTAVNVQGALRRLLGGVGPAGTALTRLSDLGVQFQSDGKLSVNSATLNKALSNMADVKTFFTASTGGMGVALKSFTDGLLASTGTITTAQDSLQSQLKRNRDAQARVEDRVASVQAKLAAQYTQLDAKMSQLSALNAYVAQQVTAWNKTGSN